MANADLRPMSIGEVLDRMFRLYKSEFWLFAGIMSLPFLVQFLLNVGVIWMARSPLGHAQSAGAPASTAVFLGLGGVFALMAVTFVLAGIGQAATIFAVSDLYLGRPATIRSSFGKVRGHILQALGVIFLTGLLVLVGFILLIIPGIILMCRTGVSVQAAMLEDAGPGTAISRSMDLTKGYSMDMFLIFLLMWVLAIGSSVLLQMPFSMLAAIPRPHILPFGLLVLQYAANFVSQVLIAPVGAIAFCLMYYNLRVRKEAFDLEHLMGSLDAGSAGGSTPGKILPA